MTLVTVAIACLLLQYISPLIEEATLSFTTARAIAFVLSTQNLDTIWPPQISDILYKDLQNQRIGNNQNPGFLKKPGL